MLVYELILRKRNGGELTAAEIDYLVQGFTKGEIPDYQMSAFCMAVYFRGMSMKETSELTMAMARSGDQVDLSEIGGIKVDKHSTGGVGDKTTLVLAPLVASAGIPVAKMSGRGLGHTGGTIDKLESIPGFSASLTKDQFVRNVNEISIAIAGQTGNLAPADKKLYALRDVTATVDSIPLIASSIMSKKIAGGSDAIVLDVKTGRGAFMSRLDEAKKLAHTMVEIGASVGRKTVALVTDMNQPLGRAVGNALEVREAIDTLQGKGPRDLEELCLALGAEMVALAGRASHEEALALLKTSLKSGKALNKLRELVARQGGDERCVIEPERLPKAPVRVQVLSDRSGFITGIDALEIGLTAMMLGAGRKTKDDVIDPSVGIILEAKTGDEVEATSPIAEIHARSQEEAEAAAKRIKGAITVGEKPPRARLIYERITP